MSNLTIICVCHFKNDVCYWLCPCVCVRGKEDDYYCIYVVCGSVCAIKNGILEIGVCVCFAVLV